MSELFSEMEMNMRSIAELYKTAGYDEKCNFWPKKPTKTQEKTKQPHTSYQTSTMSTMLIFKVCNSSPNLILENRCLSN